MVYSLSNIQKKWFYYLAGDKTKLNWYLFEITLEYYDRLRRNGTLVNYRDGYGEEQLAQYCTYYARRLKTSLLNYLSGRRKTVIFYQEYVDDFYPHHTEQLNRTLNTIARESFDHMWYGCKHCPQQCLSDHQAKSTLFDEYTDEGE